MRGSIPVTSSRFYQHDTCLPVSKRRMLYFSKSAITVFKSPTATSGLLLQTDHVIHLFMMLIHGLVREPASQHFCFLEVEENIWSKHCCPEMLADGKASERERERRERRERKRVHPEQSTSSLETTVFDEEGEESLTQCCRHTWTSVACLQAPRNECSSLTLLFIVAGRLWSFHVTLTSLICLLVRAS